MFQTRNDSLPAYDGDRSGGNTTSAFAPCLRMPNTFHDGSTLPCAADRVNCLHRAKLPRPGRCRGPPAGLLLRGRGDLDVALDAGDALDFLGEADGQAHLSALRDLPGKRYHVALARDLDVDVFEQVLAPKG